LRIAAARTHVDRGLVVLPERGLLGSRRGLDVVDLARSLARVVLDGERLVVLPYDALLAGLGVDDDVLDDVELEHVAHLADHADRLRRLAHQVLEQAHTDVGVGSTA
jgi:hypothetical protein